MRTERPTTELAGRYALEEELGRSATGMVWRATDRVLARPVTVKLVHPALADDPAFAERLAAETRRLASISAPGVARLLDTGSEDGVVFLVREHVEGESARAILQRSGPLEIAEAVRIVTGALAALAEAHAAGILHLDLEPDDILVALDGSVRVTDFGIGAAACASKAAEDVEALLGAEHLAPEQRIGAPLDERTDVFAAGATLFELLTGEPPRGRTSPRAVRGRIPRSLDRTVARALAAGPLQRFPDARSFAAALIESASGTDGAADREGASIRRERRLHGWVLVPVLLVVGTIAALALGLWLGRLEVGGPLGIRPAEDEPSPTARASLVLRPRAVAVVDPFGDGSENDSGAPLAIDGDRATAWRSENYFDGDLRKPGVGLVLDLGETVQVTGLRLWTSHPGFTFALAVGDDPAKLADASTSVGGSSVEAVAETHAALEGSGRYVLVWITSVVPVDDGNRAEVAEVRVVVDGDA